MIEADDTACGGERLRNVIEPGAHAALGDGLCQLAVALDRRASDRVKKNACTQQGAVSKPRHSKCLKDTTTVKQKDSTNRPGPKTSVVEPNPPRIVRAMTPHTTISAHSVAWLEHLTHGESTADEE